MRSGLKDRIVDYFDNFSGSASNVTFYYNPVISWLVKFVWTLFVILLVCGLFFIYKITTLAAFVVIVATIVLIYKIAKRKIGKSGTRR